MNKALAELLETCDKIGATIMSFRIYDEANETPYAVIESSEGRLSMINYEDEVWC